MKECPKCLFELDGNDECEKVCKMLRIKKSNNDNLTYPILVADFYCDKCKKTIHIKWNDIKEDFMLVKCPDCERELKASVFLGLMNGFNLKSVCFSCYYELGNGNIGGFKK